MAGTIIADYIRADANKISLNVGNTVVASINASGILSNTGSVMIAPNGAIGKSSLPSGSVLQVVQSYSSSAVYTNSSTYSDTGLTASITPTSSSNKILIMIATSPYVGASGGQPSGGIGINLQIKRNSTQLSETIQEGIMLDTRSYGTIPGQFDIAAHIHYLDSPATTSATTYTLQIANGWGSTTNGRVAINDNGRRSYITLMEIAA